MNKKIISDILVNELRYVYCDNCKFSNSDIDSPCDNCHRKYMSWALSQEAAEAITDKILNALHK